MTERSITVVCGVSRSGKTTFALRYLCNADIAYRFIFDADSGPQSYAERLRCDQAGTPFELQKQLCNQWVVFNPHVMYPGELAEGFSRFCEWVHTVCQRLPGRKLLVVDEAWRYVTPNRYPKEFAMCVQSGAGYGLGCMLNTQTPAKIPDPITNECSELVCFTLNGDKTLDWVEARGMNRDEVQALPQLHFVARNITTGGELRGRITI